MLYGKHSLGTSMLHRQSALPSPGVSLSECIVVSELLGRLQSSIPGIESRARAKEVKKEEESM